MELIKLETRIRIEESRYTDDVYLNVYYDKQKLNTFVKLNHQDNKVVYNGLDDWLECVSYNQSWFVYTNLKHEKSEFVKVEHI